MTHDLLANIIDSLGARVERIVIDDLRNHTFYAKIHLNIDGRSVQVDSRPSDAIALCAAIDAPIFVAEHVFDLTDQ
jgi:bifunctional DNase/RNase